MAKKGKSLMKEMIEPKALRALGKAARVRIYTLLCERRASAKQMVDEVGESLSMVSYHAKVLRRAGLIAQVQTVQVRGAVQRFYESVEPHLATPVLIDDQAAEEAEAALEVFRRKLRRIDAASRKRAASRAKRKGGRRSKPPFTAVILAGVLDPSGVDAQPKRAPEGERD